MPLISGLIQSLHYRPSLLKMPVVPQTSLNTAEFDVTLDSSLKSRLRHPLGACDMVWLFDIINIIGR